jgi:hypothetical protein
MNTTPNSARITTEKHRDSKISHSMWDKIKADKNVLKVPFYKNKINTTSNIEPHFKEILRNNNSELQVRKSPASWRYSTGLYVHITYYRLSY